MLNLSIPTLRDSSGKKPARATVPLRGADVVSWLPSWTPCTVVSVAYVDCGSSYLLFNIMHECGLETCFLCYYLKVNTLQRRRWEGGLLLWTSWLRRILNSGSGSRNKTFDKSVMLVQHFAYRGNSQRHKGAASHIIDMVWLYRLFIPMGRRGVFYLFIWFLSAFAAPRDRGGGSQHPVNFNLVACLMWSFCTILQIPSRCWWRLSWTCSTRHSGGRGCTWR
jgi:hypothetical protein